MKGAKVFFLGAVIILSGGIAAYGQSLKADSRVTRSNHSFLFISDIHLNTSADTTAYGYDTGNNLWRAFLEKARKVLRGPAQPEFILYTGDLPAHYSCSTGCYLPPDKRSVHNSNMDTVLTGLQSLARDSHKPIFYLPGNNDALAGDYYSFADEQLQTCLSQIRLRPYFFPAGNHVKGAVPPCMVSDPHPTMGYYSAYPVKGLRLIALNTVIYSGNFTAVDGSTQQQDGDTQMQWLAGQLAEAHKKKEKVYIAMHIPPGIDAYSSKEMWTQLPGSSWLNTFLNLCAGYKKDIAGILYGHTHMEEVRRLYDTLGKITTVAISCPGITPQHQNNPGFKTVQYDNVSKELMDFTTYYTRPKCSAWGDSAYTFHEAYGGTQGMSIYERLSEMPLSNVASDMNSIFMVRHGIPVYNTASGIEVKKD